MLMFSSRSEKAEDRSSVEGLLTQTGNREESEVKPEPLIASARLGNGN